MPQFFDPGQAMNAFASGAQMGGAIRSQQTSNALAPMVAQGDYKGAMDYAGQRGDLGQVQDMKSQYEAQLANMSEQDKAAAAQRAETIARTAAGLQGVPYEQRRALLQQNLPMLQEMGMDPAMIQNFDPTDEGIGQVLAQVTPLAELLKKPDPFTLSEGQVRYGGNNQEVARGIPKPPPEPGQAADALGRRKYTDGPNVGQVVPGFDAMKQLSGGIRIDKDGNITIGGPAGEGAFGRYSDSGGAGAFNNALESASDADTALSLLNQARGIIDGGYNSGALAPIKGKVGAILNEFGAGNGEEVADYEQFTAVNNQLAAQMLKLFGGSDTEKELAISMASNIGPGFSEATNKRMFEALEKTIAIQRQKPEYIAQWMKSHPSLDAVDPQSGLGFQATWDRYLQQQSSLYFSAANAAQPEMAGRASGGLPAGEIEALSDDDILSQLGLN